MPKTIHQSQLTIHYFRARLYHSTASVWLSVDPLSDKYPGVSPYVYCAGNPVVMKDEDGRDYEVVVDDEKKTITIRATYYSSKGNAEALQQGVDEWNNQSFKFYTGKGKQKETYTIQFDLSISSDFLNDDEASNAFLYDKSGCANFFQSAECTERGHTLYGNNITIRKDIARTLDVSTISHEIGHTLGIGEWSSGLMQSDGNGNRIGRRNIQQMMCRAGIAHAPLSSSLYNNPVDTRWEHIGKGINTSNFKKDGTVW